MKTQRHKHWATLPSTVALEILAIASQRVTGSEKVLNGGLRKWTDKGDLAETKGARFNYIAE